VLQASDFEKQLKLVIDASDVGVGVVLQQEDSEGIDSSICYYSKKFDKRQQKYSTMEKEALSLLLAMLRFDVYLNATLKPVLVFTDHNALVFLHKMRDRNQRLL